MSDKIYKLGKLYHDQSFIQVNWEKGFDFIDNAGKIVNIFHDEKNNPPIINYMNIEMLQLQRFSKTSSTLRITNNYFWNHFLNPSSLDIIYNEFFINLNKIKEILSLENKQFINFGFRNYFVYICSKEEQAAIFNKNSRIGELEILLESYIIDDTNIKIRIGKVKKIENDTEIIGILFDIDLVKKDTKKFSELKNIFKSFNTILRGKDFLSKLNNFVK